VAFAGSQYSRPNEFRGTVSLETTFGFGLTSLLSKYWDEMRIRQLMSFLCDDFIEGTEGHEAPPISRPDRIPESLLMRWIDDTQLMKLASSDLNLCLVLDSHILISHRLFY
jgi:hypothetical protein